MNFQRNSKQSPQINIIPVINVVFLLLIFFLVQGSFTKTDVLPFDAPISSKGREISGEKTEILVGDEGIIINLELVDLPGLRIELEKVLEANPQAEIMLKADAEFEANGLIEVLEVLRSSGADNIYLVTNSPI